MKTLALSLIPFRQLTYVAVFAVGSIASGQVTVTWQAIGDVVIADSSGAPLTTGSLIKLGTFGITETQIQEHAADYAFLSANFVTFDSTAVGTGDIADGLDGYWFRVSPSTSADSLGVAAKQMYLWAFNSSSGATATEQGIFTSSLWTFPGDTSVPSSSQIEFSEVTSIFIGSLGTGSIRLAAVPAAVPEPGTTAVLAGAAALALAFGHRRCRRAGLESRLPPPGENEIAGPPLGLS